MKKAARKLMNLKIREKMVYSHIFIALIPILMIGMMGIYISTGEAEKNVSQHTTQTIVQVRQMIDIYINSIEKMANMLIASVETTDFELIHTEEDVRWTEESGRIMEQFRNVADSHKEIAGIFMATENDLWISTGMTRISRDPFVEESWYCQAKEHPDEIQIISNVTGRNIVTDAEYSIDNVFSVVKAVTDPDTGEVLGVLLFDINHDIISTAIRDVVMEESGIVFVLDAEDHMVYTTPNDIVYRVNPEWLVNEGVPVNARILGKDYQIRYSESGYTGWKIVSIYSYQEIRRGVNAMFSMFFIVLVITLILVLYIAMKMSATITRPIVELAKLMKETGGGNLTVRFAGDYKDEVSELGRNFNLMLGRIQNLVDEVYKEQENKRQVELKVVQEQFKPHFLYNTLDTIGWMAREHSADDVVRLVDALTNVFRVSLSKGKDYITIKEEILYISNYLYIQRIRYGPRVNYEIDFDETCSRKMVPKLILQPLIENAIYHGVKKKRGDGHLKICVRREDERWISLSVEDDGKGMPPEKVEELIRILNQPTQPEENKSFGLFYIKERLRLRYNDKFRVNVESLEETGTKFTIYIPTDDDGSEEIR